MAEVKSDEQPFSRWRSILWPVHRFELKKLLPMLLIIFFLSFDYNVLRTMKDTLVVTAKSSGAEVIPFIKVWVMFPSAILMTFLFTRFSNYLSRERVFYVMLSFFLLYFLTFILFLYPSREKLHFNELADKLELILPLGCKGLIAMFRNWTFTTFYVMSELWSNIVLFVLFWGFANQVTKIHEAKRFYGLFGITGNFSGVIAGQSSVYICKLPFNEYLPFGTTAWEQSMTLLVLLVIGAGVLAMGVFRWMHTHVLTDDRFYDKLQAEKDKKERGKLSMRDSFSFLTRSKYLSSIAIVVIAYNLVINLVEVLWKHQLRELYPNPSDYNLYMNQITTIIGVIATFTAFFLSGNSIRKFGWTFTAMLTPAIFLATSIGFFTFFLFKGQLHDVALTVFGTTPLALVVFFGSAQNILSRAAKYTVFDATKEMTFLPLSDQAKVKGKAAIDGVCSRLGKSAGSVVHQTLLVTLSSIYASAPYVGGFLVGVIVAWMFAVRYIGKQFHILTHGGHLNATGQAIPQEEEKEESSFASPSSLTPLTDSAS